MILLDGCSIPQKTPQVIESSLQQIFLVLDFFFFMSYIINRVGVWSFCLRSPGPGPKLLDGSVLLKFVLETRLESKFFEPVIDFLRVRVQMLWPKINGK